VKYTVKTVKTLYMYDKNQAIFAKIFYLNTAVAIDLNFVY